MSDPVKPETRGRIVDENLSGKRRRPTTGITALRSGEGAPVPTSTDRGPDSGSSPRPAGVDPRAISSPPLPAAPPQPPSQPPSPAPARAPSSPPAPATAREISGAQTARFVGSLDPDMPSPQEASGSRPRPRETSGPRPRAAGLDPAVEAPASDAERRGSESQPRPKKKKKNLNPMIGAGAGAFVILAVIIGSLLPQMAVRASVKLADPVPDIVSLWGGRVDAPALQSYVNRVAADVAAKSVAIPTVTVHVAQDPAAHAVALPGRELVITAGLLRRLSTEAQLAAVVAHLLAHIESGEIDKAFLAGTDPDLKKRARTAGTTPATAERERGFTARTGELMKEAGFVTAAFTDAHGALSARSGRLSSFVQQHPVPPDALAAIRTAAEGGRSADVDYTRNVLDPLGRAAAPPPERSVNPPLPPKPPPTPKLDLSRPSDRVKREGMPQPPPRKAGAMSEPPAPPL